MSNPLKALRKHSTVQDLIDTDFSEIEWRMNFTELTQTVSHLTQQAFATRSIQHKRILLEALTELDRAKLEGLVMGWSQPRTKHRTHDPVVEAWVKSIRLLPARTQ